LAVWQAVPIPAYLGTGWSDDASFKLYMGPFRCVAPYLDQNLVLFLPTFVPQSSFSRTAMQLLRSHTPAWYSFCHTCAMLHLPACRVFLFVPKLALCREAYACPSLNVTSFLTNLVLAVLPTGQAVRLPHPACLPALLSVCLSVRPRLCSCSCQHSWRNNGVSRRL